jgi:hypothetical protein
MDEEMLKCGLQGCVRWNVEHRREGHFVNGCAVLVVAE